MPSICVYSMIFIVYNYVVFEMNANIITITKYMMWINQSLLMIIWWTINIEYSQVYKNDNNLYIIWEIIKI